MALIGRRPRGRFTSDPLGPRLMHALGDLEYCWHCGWLLIAITRYLGTEDCLRCVLQEYSVHGFVGRRVTDCGESPQGVLTVFIHRLIVSVSSVVASRPHDHRRQERQGRNAFDN